MLKKWDKEAGFHPSTLRQLLKSRNATEVLLFFLTIIGVGQQPRAQEQRGEEQRKCGIRT